MDYYYHATLFALVLIILTLQVTTHYSYATVRSPSFIRQEVVDQPYPDWGLMIFDSGQFSGFSAISPCEIKNTTGVDIGDIESIYYVSDGKTLNVTFWLNSPFVEKPSSHIPSTIFL